MNLRITAAMLFLFLSASFARASEASVINESCQDPVQSSALYAPVTSFSVFAAQMASWSQWTAADVASLPSALTIDTVNTSFNSGVLWVYFTLNGKSGQALAWARNFGKTADGPTPLSLFGTTNKAIFIIPGSGNNQTVAMMANTGYQAVLFSIGTAVGDAFVYSYPGQDLQILLCQNGKKLITGSIDNAIQDNGSSTTNFVLVQTAAIMKFLQTGHSVNPLFPSYSQIGVMGLSKGAWVAMMTSIITPPTAAVIASGVSLKEYRSLGFGALGGNISSGIASAWPAATLTSAINASRAHWLFTLSGCCGELAMILEEAATSETATAFSGANVTTLVHSQGHVYPAPNTKTFLQTNMP